MVECVSRSTRLSEKEQLRPLQRHRWHLFRPLQCELAIWHDLHACSARIWQSRFVSASGFRRAWRRIISLPLSIKWNIIEDTEDNRVILSDKDAVTEWTLGLRGPCVLDEVTL